MLQLTEGITGWHLSQVYSDPYIVGAIQQDGRPAKPVSHPCAVYLSAFLDDRFLGAFLAIRFSKHEMELHSLLHRDALKHSRELGRQVIEWSFDHDIQRITAYVIDGLHKAANYCRRLGFVDEGRRRHACMKNGHPTDVLILGLTRQDWRKS